MDDFLVRAGLAGLGVAAAAGPLGCFIVWRRMAYFGDSLAHSALLGVALGIAFGIAETASILLLSGGFALLLFWLQAQKRLATDTLLGILSHTALALGIVALSFMESVRVDLLSYLFGEILSVTWIDVAWIYGGAVIVLASIAILWSSLLRLTVHEQLAQAEGLNTGLLRAALMLLIALVVAVAMRLVGILLITALLIIPPAAARQFARSPEAMAIWASLTGMLSVVLGLWMSFALDTPSGPSVVVAAAGLFLTASLAGAAIGGRARHTR